MRGLKNRGWTQKRLAEEVGKKEAQISRLVNADANCTFETASRILFALGIRARIVEETTAEILSVSRSQIRPKKDASA